MYKKHKATKFTLLENLHLTNLSYNTDSDLIRNELASKEIKNIFIENIATGEYAKNGLNAIIYSRKKKESSYMITGCRGGIMPNPVTGRCDNSYSWDQVPTKFSRSFRTDVRM